MLPWREAGTPNHLDDKVDSDQQVVNNELSLWLATPDLWKEQFVFLALNPQEAHNLILMLMGAPLTSANCCLEKPIEFWQPLEERIDFRQLLE